MKSKRKSTPPGIYPKAHPKPVREFIDQDYLRQLDGNPEAQQFLANFNDCYYSGDYSNELGKAWDGENRRASTSRVHCSQRDIQGLSGVFGTLSSFDPDLHDQGTRAEEAPEDDDLTYLEHPRYKAALQAWRDCPDTDHEVGKNAVGKKVLHVRVTSPEKRRLYLELERTIRLGKAGLLDLLDLP